MEWIESLPDWIVKPAFKIVNRSQNRAYLKSAKKINYDVSKIEEMFLADLFLDGILTLSYKDIYNFHLDQFKNVIEWHLKLGNHKNIKINETYFVDKYKPIQNTKN